MSFKKVSNQHDRSPLSKARGKELMAKSVGRAGEPSDNSKPPVMPKLVKDKIAESKRKK